MASFSSAAVARGSMPIRGPQRAGAPRHAQRLPGWRRQYRGRRCRPPCAAFGDAGAARQAVLGGIGQRHHRAAPCASAGASSGSATRGSAAPARHGITGPGPMACAASITRLAILTAAASPPRSADHRAVKWCQTSMRRADQPVRPRHRARRGPGHRRPGDREAGAVQAQVRIQQVDALPRRRRSGHSCVQRRPAGQSAPAQATYCRIRPRAQPAMGLRAGAARFGARQRQQRDQIGVPALVPALLGQHRGAQLMFASAGSCSSRAPHACHAARSGMEWAGAGTAPPTPTATCRARAVAHVAGLDDAQGAWADTRATTAGCRRNSGDAWRSPARWQRRRETLRQAA